MFDWIKRLTDSDYDSPFKEKAKAKPVKAVYYPKNVRWHYGRPFIHIETPDGFEMQELECTENRTDKITDMDREHIKHNGLNEAKYRKIKISWARGISVRDLAKRLENESGYSKTIITQYYAVMNRIDAIPLSGKEGG